MTKCVIIMNPLCVIHYRDDNLIPWTLTCRTWAYCSQIYPSVISAFLSGSSHIGEAGVQSARELWQYGGECAEWFGVYVNCIFTPSSPAALRTSCWLEPINMFLITPPRRRTVFTYITNKEGRSGWDGLAHQHRAYKITCLVSSSLLSFSLQL